MANQKIDVRDYEAAAPQQETTTDQNQFILAEEAPLVPPAPLISEVEQTKRDLQRRFKKLFGYKPTGVDPDELLRAVEAAEHTRALKRDGIL